MRFFRLSFAEPISKSKLYIGVGPPSIRSVYPRRRMRGGVGAPAVRDHAARLAAALTSFSLSRWPSENSLLQRLVLGAMLQSLVHLLEWALALSAASVRLEHKGET